MSLLKDRKQIVHGIEMCFNEQFDFWHSIEDGQWEANTFKAIKDFYKPGKTFIDIGAWNGVLSLYAEKLGAVVCSVEPDFAAINLYENLMLCNNAGCHLFKGAISDTNGTATLNSNANCFGNSESSLVNRGVINGERQVKTMKLEFYVEAFGIDIGDVFLIKIDVEGNEINILEQARGFISLHRPNMHISFHPAWLPAYEDYIKRIDYLFGIYNVTCDDGTPATLDNFQELLDNHKHAFIFA